MDVVESVVPPVVVVVPELLPFVVVAEIVEELDESVLVVRIEMELLPVVVDDDVSVLVVGEVVEREL